MITQSTCFSANGLLSVGKKKQLYWFFKFWLVCLQKSNVLFIRLTFFSLHLTHYTHQFISEVFPGTVKYDRTKINICTIDIEVGSENGFPEPDQALYDIITITIKNNNVSISHSWGNKEFNADKCTHSVL